MMRKEVKEHDGFPYIIMYPENFRKDKKYPVILFLHGAGARGTDISILAGNTITSYFSENPGLPFILVEPLCRYDTWFAVFEHLISFADFVRSEEYCDQSRFCLTGNSMGGYAAWMLAMSRPDWFAALVPVCGGGMTWHADVLKNIPIWAFHGLLDDIVPAEESIKMVRAVNESGGNAKITLYHDVRHNSWEKAYADAELYQWLLMR